MDTTFILFLNSSGKVDGFIPLNYDRQVEMKKKQKEVDKLVKLIASIENKLSNENFTSKAPAHVVEQVRKSLIENQQKLESILRIIHYIQNN